MVPAIVVGGGIHFFPYSPRWLVLRGRHEDSLLSLAKLRRLSENDHRVQAEWKGIIAEVKFQNEMEAQEHPNTGPFMLEIKAWIDLFKAKLWRRTIVAVMIPFFQQVRHASISLTNQDLRKP